MIPGQPAECIPVGLEEWMTGPVSFIANIGNTGNSGYRIIVDRSINHFGHRRAFSFCISIRIETFLKQRSFKNEMSPLSKIFHGDLEFHHQWCLRHGAE